MDARDNDENKVEKKRTPKGKGKKLNEIADGEKKEHTKVDDAV